MTDDYRSLNQANWNERAPAHAASPGYSVQRFLTEPDYLSDVVRFDKTRLGDLTGQRGVHLQCHIGTDTLSLHRLGARMTALDFSAPALAEARKLAEAVGADIDYIEAELYDAVDVLGAGRFDLVYTGVGALCWLPDIARWGALVAELLAPGGRLFIREGHPALWAIDDERTDVLSLKYAYFETPEPLIWTDPETYVPTDVQFVHNTTASWNHGLGEIVTAVLDAGLQLSQLIEHDSVPWCALPGQMTELPNGEWRLTDHPERLPHTYTLQARKPL